MSTKAIRELLSDYLSVCASANDFRGGARAPTDAERKTYRAALIEVEAIERAAVALHRCNATPYTADSPRGQMYYRAMKLIHTIAEEAP